MRPPAGRQQHSAPNFIAPVIDSLRTAEGGHQVMLRPNCSLSWRVSVRLLVLLTVVLLLIATSAAVVVGAWMVFPFAGLELAVVAACFYYLSARSMRREVITFSPDAVVIERGRQRPDEGIRFPRYHTTFCVERADHPWYPCRVIVRGHGLQAEVGSFLAEGEKAQLIDELVRIVSAFRTAHMSVAAGATDAAADTDMPTTCHR